MGFENALSCPRNAENGFGFDISRPITQKNGDEFLNNIVSVTGDKSWVSFVNVENKEQSKQWMHTHSPKKSKKCKQTLSACQMVTISWDRKRSSDGGIHARMDYNNVL
jgi:hypothetical protein